MFAFCIFNESNFKNVCLIDLQRKRLSKPRQVVEMGTQNSEVDYDWIPKETLKGLSKFMTYFISLYWRIKYALSKSIYSHVLIIYGCSNNERCFKIFFYVNNKCNRRHQIDCKFYAILLPSHLLFWLEIIILDYPSQLWTRHISFCLLKWLLFYLFQLYNSFNILLYIFDIINIIF